MKNNLTLKNSGRRREQEQITTVDQEIQINNNLYEKVPFTTRCCTYRDILLSNASAQTEREIGTGMQRMN